LPECLALLRDNPSARLLAGGTDLAVESNLAGRRFSHLISVEALPELGVFEDGPAAIEIGAGLTLDEIQTRWKDAPAAVRQWFRLFASPLIRNRATLGGNLATASSIGDAAPLLLALDAAVKIAGPDGIRAVPLSAFFTGYRRTVLAPGEILVSVAIPKPFPAVLRFFKLAKRKADDISTVAAVFALDFDRRGRVEMARFAFGGVAPTPIRAVDAEAEILGEPWNPAAVRQAQAAIRRTLAPLTDHRGSAEYRLAMAQSLLAKFQCEAPEGAAV
jgi:xanthine dehydrogenase small subunit